jgi:peptide/nickel transport system substrate-binding protein
VRAQLEGKSAQQQRALLQQQFLGAPIATSRQGPPVTSGPFRFQRWVPGQSLTMVRNPNYWQQNPTGVQRITYRFFAQTNTLQVQLLAGQIDATSSVGVANSPQTLQALRQGARNVYDLYQVAGGIWEHMNLNLFTNVREVADLGLADVRTRQALIYAIDRRSLANELLAGTVSPTNTFVHPSSPVYSAAGANEYSYNAERATQLLAELGWRRGSDGILERTVDGRTVKFVLELAPPPATRCANATSSSSAITAPGGHRRAHQQRTLRGALRRPLPPARCRW